MFCDSKECVKECTGLEWSIPLEKLRNYDANLKFQKNRFTLINLSFSNISLIVAKKNFAISSLKQPLTLK